MRLCLLRHAEAERASDRVRADADRGLSLAGREEARRTAAILRDAGFSFDRVLVSPLMRAVQTAEIVAAALGHGGPVESLPFLGAAGRWRKEIDALLADILEGGGDGRPTVLLVGHNPDMSDLAAAVLGLQAGELRLGTGCACIVDIDHPTAAVPGRLVGLVDPAESRLRKRL